MPKRKTPVTRPATGNANGEDAAAVPPTIDRTIELDEIFGTPVGQLAEELVERMVQEIAGLNLAIRTLTFSSDGMLGLHFQLQCIRFEWPEHLYRAAAIAGATSRYSAQGAIDCAENVVAHLKKTGVIRVLKNEK